MEAAEQGKGGYYKIENDKGPSTVIVRAKQLSYLTNVYDVNMTDKEC